MKKLAAILMAGLLIFSSCGMSNAGRGSLIGTGAGAAIGAAVGMLITGDANGAVMGAAIGGAAGAGTGALIGNKMDKKAEELAALENASIETITDANGLPAIKVTFASGILFPTNGTSLQTASKEEIAEFASKMADLPDTDITVWGHTDNTGSAAVNERVSKQRAEAVASHLQKSGIDAKRIYTEGKSYNNPVADNETEEGRAQNRRVEIYITANQAMIDAAANGTLQ